MTRLRYHSFNNRLEWGRTSRRNPDSPIFVTKLHLIAGHKIELKKCLNLIKEVIFLVLIYFVYNLKEKFTKKSFMYKIVWQIEKKNVFAFFLSGEFNFWRWDQFGWWNHRYLPQLDICGWNNDFQQFSTWKEITKNKNGYDRFPGLLCFYKLLVVWFKWLLLNIVIWSSNLK